MFKTYLLMIIFYYIKKNINLKQHNNKLKFEELVQNSFVDNYFLLYLKKNQCATTYQIHLK